MSSKTKFTFLMFLLGMLSAFGPFVTDLYLPALPNLADYFKATPSASQLSLTMSMLGLSIGQLFIGPLSDKYGRKRLLVICLVLFVVGTCACIYAPDIAIFNICRLLQGLAASGGIVIARSVSADSYRGPVLTKFLAMVSAVNGVAPIVAPVLGGFLLNFMSWKGTFAVLLIYGFVLLFMAGKFQESLAPHRRSQKSILASFTLYGEVFRNGEFVRYFLVCSASMIVLFGYIAASPFIFQKLYGLSPIGFSLCFALIAVCTAIGCATSGKIRSDRTAIKIAGFGVFAASLAVAACLLTHAPLPLLQASFMVTTFMFGLMQPPASALALNAERKNAGTASAAMGAAGFLMGGIASPIVGMGGIAVSASAMLVTGGFLTMIFMIIAKSKMPKKQ
ncbi:multidrug effflux MFS transporter [Fibrobacter sp. UWEL]|uniref:multidrug effflux MFS transporter n=1 Tax=Fibrobacter sp. UWEL TaxID=1896209 RepID=UPI000914C5B8|nr:multidrug effflux MFS transporter [Fibrobacter sp. UWEL]SHK37716.1 MFS transporter, DHA1 family, bicyclomycin/chloramphenicol resistance protein [Fibrobacter sp. UWEL]